MKTKRQVHARLQVQLLLSQLAALRRELREALHAYEARVEITVAEIVNEISVLRTANRIVPAQCDQVAKMIALLQRRKLKPEKGRRKDLRKIEDLVNELRELSNADA